NFDDEVEFSEKLMWLGGKRRKLCKEAYGNVLEVSAGTGRNMEYYNLDSVRTPRDKRIRSLVFNDLSEIMVYQAEKKFDELQEEKEQIAKFRGPVKFVVGDASDRRIISRPEGGFDTILQTMGVCSMANPVGFLRRLGQLTDERDKGGKILLLEHGRSYYNIINRFLDGNAKMHAHRYGCWNNKDIDQVIEDSGLEIESKRRYHFGTTYEYVLRP
ncbi:ubiquinone/menaquinone biosynthesis methyltransferase, partial [Exophiala viscosa]